MLFVIGLGTFFRALFSGSAAIALENLALRHQLAVHQRSVRRPRLSRWDRILWVWLTRIWTGWRSSLVIVQPATVLAWHRQGFRLYWGWKSKPHLVGRPKLAAEIRLLIRQMARDNPTWGRRRVQAELALLGYTVAELTVAKYMHRRTSPWPSPTWRAFLHAHLREIVAVDFFLVPTLTFRLLFVFVVLRHDRRELLHVNVTDHPTAVWTARQLVQAFPDDSAPTFLLRDRDAIYGEEFGTRVKYLGVREVLTAPRAPWQNPLVERVIGSIRRECLDQVVILNAAHLQRLLRAYVAYYNTVRPHQALEQNAPRPRTVQPPALGRVVAIPQVGGLHHLYQRAA
jgi:putative transposase